MKTYPFYFKVRVWEESKRRYSIQTGVGLAGSFAQAAQTLEERYKDELCAIQHLELFAEDNLIFLPQAACEAYQRADFPEIDFEIVEVEKNV